MSDEKIKIIATNRKARHEYIIEDTLEAGLVLLGTEIKSIRAGRANIQEAYITYRDGEMWVLGMHISAYDPAHRMNHDPLRPRKLLLHRREIARWVARSQQRGYTMIPLQLYLRRGRAKLEIALAKGKKIYDKRESIAERETKRRIEREMSERTRRRG
jgi:SsrA-binding protein